MFMLGLVKLLILYARYVRVGVAELLDTSEGGAVMSRCGSGVSAI